MITLMIQLEKGLGMTGKFQSQKVMILPQMKEKKWHMVQGIFMFATSRCRNVDLRLDIYFEDYILHRVLNGPAKPLLATEYCNPN